MKVDKVNSAQWALNPTIKTRHLAVTSWVHDIPSDTVNASHMESSMVQLSHLEFLPPCGDAAGRMAPPTILAVRSHLPGSTSHYNQDVHTTVDRWEVREKPQTIHPAFEQLSSRRNSVGSQPGVSLPLCIFGHENSAYPYSLLCT
jgi:mediator of RNA polymerase II transcription subunit 16